MNNGIEYNISFGLSPNLYSAPLLGIQYDLVVDHGRIGTILKSISLEPAMVLSYPLRGPKQLNLCDGVHKYYSA